MNDSEKNPSGHEPSNPRDNVPPLEGNVPPEAANPTEPAYEKVLNYLLYGASLPERALRSTTALVGGAVKESASLLVPQAFRNSTSYTKFIGQSLDFLCGNVGGVATPNATDSPASLDGFVARKSVGSFLDFAGMATLHLSPMAVLSIVSDVAYGSQVYLKQLSDELKREGVISQDTTIDHAADLLSAIRDTSTRSVELFDMPPLSVEGLQKTIEDAQATAKGIRPDRLLPRAELDRLWQEMAATAQKENVSIFEVSSTMSLFLVNRVGDVGRGAFSSVRVAGSMLDEHVVNHYRDALSHIRESGFYATLSESAKPYIGAVWNNFSRTKPTLTEDVLSGKLLGRVWGGMHAWWTAKPEGDAGGEGGAREEGNGK